MSRMTTLTTQVVMVLSCAAIVPTVAVGYLAIRHAQEDVEREVVRGNLALIRALGASLDATLQDTRQMVELIASNWAYQRSPDPARPDAVQPDPATDDPARPQEDAVTAGDRPAPAGPAQPEPTERLLERVRRSMPMAATITITDPRGRPIFGHPKPPQIAAGAHMFGGYFSDIFFEDGRPKVALVTQARNRTGELVADFIVGLDLQFVADALRELVEESRLGRGARLWVVDGAGRPVARSDGAPTGVVASLRNVHPAVDRALSSTREGGVEADGVIAVYRNIASFQSDRRSVRWAIILEQPTEYAYALARKTTRDTVLTGVAVLALSLLIGVALAARLTRP
ncbi:MAG: cache domain-containing protein, partial [Myxococcota bacterium]